MAPSLYSWVCTDGTAFSLYLAPPSPYRACFNRGRGGRYGTTDATTVYEPEPLSKARLQAQQGHKPNKDGRAIARKRERLQEDTTSTIYQTNRFSEHVVKRAQPLQTGALMQSPPVLPDALVRTDSLQDLEGEEGSGMIPLTLKDQTRYFEHGGKVDEAAGTERT